MNRKRGNKMAQSKYEVGDVIKNEKRMGSVNHYREISGRRHCEWQLPVITRGFL